MNVLTALRTTGLEPSGLTACCMYAGFHWDRDYGLEQAKGLCVYPHLATVTYLGDAGGPTIVVDAAGDPTR